METLKKILRSIQVFFPFIQDYRFIVQRTLRKLLNQTHEKDFDALSLFDANGKLFVDIGTNRGEAIQSILMRVPSADIIGFEPNPIVYAKTTKVYPDVKIFNYGLGDQIKTERLFVPFYNNYMFDGLASFKEHEARGWLRNRLYLYDERKLELKTATCEVKKLDDFSLDPFFIKIDVQGFEYEVLLGAKETLQCSKPIILLEAVTPEQIEFLTSLGYWMYYYSDHTLKEGQGSLNTFFVHPQMKGMVWQSLN